MKAIGLLTDKQKRAGLFITQDADFIYLFYRNGGKPGIVAIYLYDTATIKEIRETAEETLRELKTDGA